MQPQLAQTMKIIEISSDSDTHVQWRGVGVSSSQFLESHRSDRELGTKAAGQREKADLHTLE